MLFPPFVCYRNKFCSPMRVSWVSVECLGKTVKADRGTQRGLNTCRLLWNQRYAMRCAVLATW